MSMSGVEPLMRRRPQRPLRDMAPPMRGRLPSMPSERCGTAYEEIPSRPIMRDTEPVCMKGLPNALFAISSWGGEQV